LRKTSQKMQSCTRLCSLFSQTWWKQYKAMR